MKGSKYVRAAALAVVLTALVGCNELVRSKLQGEIDKLWTTPTRKAKVEDDLEQKLEEQVDATLGGKEFEVPGPNPYLHHVKTVRVNLGSKSPELSIPGKVTFTQTDTHYYLTFEWGADWKNDNGAKVDLELDLRSHKWYLFNEFPDHTVKLSKISAQGGGTAVVAAPKAGGKAVASITLKNANLDLEAEAKGWFWTIDVSKQIKGQLNDELLRKFVGKSIEYAFDANIPGI
ncbi:MAG: hypothetical protein AB7N76_19330 [Planctomycetota bacterium]